MNWGKWIFLSFVLFATFIAVLVVISMRQRVNLVSKEYYQEELAYQDQIDRLKNTEALPVKPVIEVSTESVRVTFPSLKNVENGVLRLFRPSDDRLDQTIKVQSTDSVFRQTIRPLVKGLYRAQFTWTMEGKEYYVESIVNL